jgi:AraC family transcriptional regulator
VCLRHGVAYEVAQMNSPAGGPVERALWFIESHFARDITLDEVSDAACVSRYHMSRVFAVSTGIPLMRYVRARRLSVAAKALANGAPDILSVALDVGYGSHEAFTRAFREQFGLTPESVRAQGHLSNLRVTEAMKMGETLLRGLEARFENGRVLLISGMGSRYNCGSTEGIAPQWQGLVPHIGNIPGQLGRNAYGVMCNFDEDGNFDYICGVEVKNFSQGFADWARVRIASLSIPSVSTTVNKIRGTVGSDSVIHCAASIPLISGIDRSRITTSGLSSSNFLTPDHPLSASPQTNQ